MSIPETKLQTSSTVQLEMSSRVISCGRGLSLSEFLPLLGVLTLGLFIGVVVAADKSRGEEMSCGRFPACFSKVCISASFAVLTICNKVCVDDMSMRGGNIGLAANGFRIFGKSGFLVAPSSFDAGKRFDMAGLVLKRLGSKGGKPLRATPK